MNSKIRLSKSCVGEEEANAVARVVKEGYLGMGDEVKNFENDLKKYLGTTYEVVCVNTGTSALHLALACMGVGDGDEVLVPTITYVATFQAISATGATPIACDVSPDRVFIDLDDAKKRITQRTRAIMPVHFASDSSGMSEVYRFADVHQLRVIEDAAHAFGCSRNGAKVGAEGDVICFSFDGIKNITSGEGGAVVTGDLLLANRIKDARLLGVERDTEMRYRGERSWEFDVKYQGFRYHMSNLMAAIGREQLKKIDKFSAIRRSAADSYYELLRNIPNIEFLKLDHENIVPHIFPIKILNDKRDYVMGALMGSGIECGVHYKPNHLTTFFNANYSLPCSEVLAKQLLSLPLHPGITREDQKFVCQMLLKALND